MPWNSNKSPFGIEPSKDVLDCTWIESAWSKSQARATHEGQERKELLEKEHQREDPTSLGFPLVELIGENDALAILQQLFPWYSFSCCFVAEKEKRWQASCAFQLWQQLSIHHHRHCLLGWIGWMDSCFVDFENYEHLLEVWNTERYDLQETCPHTFRLYGNQKPHRISEQLVSS